jgi:hypothetical protein
MAEQDQEATLNDTGTPSVPMESGEFLSTAEFEAPSESAETEGPAKEGETATKADSAEPGKSKEGGEETPKEDEHGDIPYSRFKEKIDQHKSEVDQLRQGFETKIANLEGQLEIIKATKPSTESNDGAKPNYKNMATMSKNELQDWFDDDMVGFMGNLAAQIQHETMETYRSENAKVQQTQQQEGIKKEFNKNLEAFKGDHEDFEPMIKDGSLKKFIDENPWHNAFSAYYALTEERREESVNQKIEAAVKEATEKLRKEFEQNIKAKRNIRSIDAGPTPTTVKDSELSDTSKRGGLTSVLADRLAARRRKAS